MGLLDFLKNDEASKSERIAKKAARELVRIHQQLSPGSFNNFAVFPEITKIGEELREKGGQDLMNKALNIIEYQLNLPYVRENIIKIWLRTGVYS
ncbi:MAG: hypothetical protein LBN74_09510 [Prevotella sp.]|jgi:hypothetical protein|nr:hypothetical protein [Prevotella sp.]